MMWYNVSLEKLVSLNYRWCACGSDMDNKVNPNRPQRFLVLTIDRPLKHWLKKISKSAFFDEMQKLSKNLGDEPTLTPAPQ